MPDRVLRAVAPGRVNLIGDHTDYTGGLVLPMAIDRSTEVEGEAGGDAVVLESELVEGRAVVPLDVDDPASVRPSWARYVAGVVAELRPVLGFRGVVRSSLPVGAGLSSSAALEVAVALALGFGGTPLELAELCRRAEQRASGVPCGIMDQLASAAGVAGHALLIDCTSLSVEPVALPDEVEVLVVHSGEERALSGSAYAARREQCEAAAAVVGPLRDASVEDLDAIDDRVVRSRARHVVTENERVLAFAEAMAEGRLEEAGRSMLESHASLRDDFEVSTDALDGLVARLAAADGVHGARLTGAGFGGCVVALADAGSEVGMPAWRVRASAGARRL